MDMYNIFDHGSAETYLIQGAETNPLLTSSLVGEIETMYNKGASEFVIDSGFYYPTASNYGYYCTGFDSPGEWDEHHQVFPLDGPDAQYTDVQTENLPYVYYTPTYGYAESPYNPYNPYIPGAMLGFDGSYVGTQQLYAIPSYHTPVSSPAYYPIVDQSQSRLDIIPHASPDPLLDTSMATSGRSNGVGFRHNLSTPSTAFAMMSSRPAPNQTHSLGGVTEVRRTNVGPGKQSLAQGSVIASTYPGAASTPVLQGKRMSGSIQVTDNMPNGRVLSHNNKVSLPSSNDFSSLGLAAAEQATAEKLHSRSHYDKPFSVPTVNVDTAIEQNRGPRMSRRSKQLAVKAYTTRAGDINSQGEIIINADQYNSNDFPLDYANSKFFVIKSYSEDDVHKSIKYNVWSSTPNGNRKLDIAYEDAQRLSAGCSRACPVFLFFSVNASGQFCGVAEMLGAVDFHRDMDFWQQDKWNGSFPVRWHFIKDVPNNNFRHIILENNENKPVTNSRDTQEILYKQGLEMLKIFKSYASRTSLLDDFMYYESRQKIMYEEKTRLLISSYERPLFISGVDPPRKLNCGFGSTPASIRSLEKTSDTVDTELRKEASAPDPVSSITEATVKTSSSEETGNHIDTKTKADGVSTLKIGSLAIDPKKLESEQSNGDGGATEQVGGVVKVGSMAVRVNGFSASSGGFLTVGSIPLDPRSLKAGKEEALSAKGGSQPQGG